MHVFHCQLTHAYMMYTTTTPTFVTQALPQFPATSTKAAWHTATMYAVLTNMCTCCQYVKIQWAVLSTCCTVDTIAAPTFVAQALPQAPSHQHKGCMAHCCHSALLQLEEVWAAKVEAHTIWVGGHEAIKCVAACTLYTLTGGLGEFDWCVDRRLERMLSTIWKQVGRRLCADR